MGEQQWIVVGRSYKMEGLLYCVTANGKENAIRQVSDINETQFLKVPINEGKDTVYALHTEKDIKPEDIIEACENLEARWFWIVEATPLTMGRNMRDAVQW